MCGNAAWGDWGIGQEPPIIRRHLFMQGELPSMRIELKPEIEALIQQDVDRWPYETAGGFVEHAVGHAA